MSMEMLLISLSLYHDNITEYINMIVSTYLKYNIKIYLTVRYLTVQLREFRYLFSSEFTKDNHVEIISIVFFFFFVNSKKQLTFK